MIFVSACLFSGLALKLVLVLFLKLLTKINILANKFAYFIFLGGVITYWIISFFPKSNSNNFNKDEKWSFVYLITFGFDFIIIQQVIGAIQYISTIEIMNNEAHSFNKIFYNPLFVSKIKWNFSFFKNE